jgi:hypothetical protein
MLRRPAGGSGYGLPRSWLRHSHGKPPPHFGGPAFATQTLIRAAKTSYTAGTLCTIKIEFSVKKFENH